MGIDTSCDDTSCAVVEDGKKILSNVISSQTEIHSLYGGVVPEIASRKHLEIIGFAANEALRRAGLTLGDLDALAVTAGPGLPGALLVGVCYAKALAAGISRPVVGVNHVEGHIYANFLKDDIPEFPCLNLVVSGGHTELILMVDHGRYVQLGETLDDAAGEVFDKVAREMGLPYPGGPYLDRAAENGDPTFCKFPHPKIEGSKYAFSFSGLKTRAIQEFEKRGRREDVIDHLCASFREAVVRDLLYYVPELVNRYGVKSFALAGGVAANKLLRARAKELCTQIGIPLHIPPLVLCTDNGAMIASAGYQKLIRGFCDGPNLSIDSDLELGSWGGE